MEGRRQSLIIEAASRRLLSAVRPPESDCFAEKVAEIDHDDGPEKLLEHLIAMVSRFDF